MGLIYAYKKIDENKIVYVGQTTNLDYRRYKHEKYDPTHQQVVEYEYPLSRAIRKHGLDNFELIILEDNIQDEQVLINREMYWIEYYNTYKNGYNQTPGGKAPKYIKFEKETIDFAKTLIKEGKMFKDISEITGISIVHLSEINTGRRHHDDNEHYPLKQQTCGRKFSLEQINEIYELIQFSNKTLRDIARQYEVSDTTIYQINSGKKYHNSNFVYPLRKRKSNVK